MQLIMTRGLPASGKSSWASDYVLTKAAGAVIRVNKDTLREMLHAGRWKGNKTEPTIERVRDLLVEFGLSNGLDVVVDDTNFGDKHERVLRALAVKYDAKFSIQDFTDVPIEECIKRDLKRTASVGEAVIRRMWSQHLAPPSDPIVHVPGRPSAVMVDIDGTVALMSGRSPYDPTKYHTDTPFEAVVDLVQQLDWGGDRILFCSGRDDTYRRETTEWLDKNVGLESYDLFMRHAPDKRKDWIVKQELFDTHIRNEFNVRFVLDDRNQVVDAWRRIGLPCFQVNNGAF